MSTTVFYSTNKIGMTIRHRSCLARTITEKYIVSMKAKNRGGAWGGCGPAQDPPRCT